MIKTDARHRLRLTEPKAHPIETVVFASAQMTRERTVALMSWISAQILPNRNSEEMDEPNGPISVQ